MTRWRVGLALLFVLGLAIRVVYGLALDEPSGDAAFYHQVANRIADGDGFSNPFLDSPTAAHPPLFPLLLSLVSLAGGTSLEAHQVAGCVLGAATVVVVGLAGRRLAGPAAGLAAAALAAVYPPLVANDSLLLSESVYGLAVATVLLAALWALGRGGPKPALVLGAAIGLATLCRTEALMFLLLLIPVLWRGGAGFGGREAALVALATVLVVVPWTARNLVAFDRVVLVSTNDGSVFAGANCPSAYGALLGSWDLRCSLGAGVSRRQSKAEARALEEALRTGRATDPALRGRNEAVVAERQRDAGLDYARENAGRIPAVVAARVGRTWSLYRQGEQVRTNRFLRGSPAWLEWLTVLGFFAAAALAAAGAWFLRGRWPELLILLTPFVLVTVASALGYGTPRFRQAAEVAIVLLAGVAVSRPFSPRRPAG